MYGGNKESWLAPFLLDQNGKSWKLFYHYDLFSWWGIQEFYLERLNFWLFFPLEALLLFLEWGSDVYVYWSVFKRFHPIDKNISALCYDHTIICGLNILFSFGAPIATAGITWVAAQIMGAAGAYLYI